MVHMIEGLLLASFLLQATVAVTPNIDPCKAASTHDDVGSLQTLCETPYCKCNDPYGSVYCSCIPSINTLPTIWQLTIQSSGSCRVNPETKDLIIRDCNNVTFPSKGLEILQNLRTVQVINAKEVVLERHSFHWNASIRGSVSISITNSTIVDLPSYTFSGRIHRVAFRGVYLGLIRAFAFSSITDTERIQFVDCNFANIEPQSFKKFTTQELLFDNSQFHIVPSRFITDVHVYKLFRIHENFIAKLRTLAFHISHPEDTTVSNNRINVIEGEALHVLSHGRVTIRDNFFETIEAGAFQGITLDKRTPTIVIPELLFDNNTIGTVNEAALSFDKAAFHVRLTKVLIDDLCSCDGLLQWRDILYPSKKDDRGPVEPHLTEVWCHLESKKEKDFDFISGDEFYKEHCTQLISSIYFFVIIIVSTTIVLCVIIVVAILIIRRRQRWDTPPTTYTQGVVPKPAPPGSGLVLPDGRVYRETEFSFIGEKVEPMDEIIPYKVTRDRSKVMLTRDTPR